MKASETQVGGNWYKDMPRCYQPIIMSDALGLTPWEYNVLKRLLAPPHGVWRERPKQGNSRFATGFGARISQGQTSCC